MAAGHRVEHGVGNQAGELTTAGDRCYSVVPAVQHERRDLDLDQTPADVVAAPSIELAAYTVPAGALGSGGEPCQQPHAPAQATGGTAGDQRQRPHPLRAGEAQLEGDARPHRETDDVGRVDTGIIHHRERVRCHHRAAVGLVGLVA